MIKTSEIGLVAIGRNEGQRLIDCLEAIAASEVVPERVVYVDSGSTDGSVAEARARGAEVVELDTARPFTAARARNAGLAALRAGERPALVQFVDGDCAVRPDWIGTARDFLRDNPKAAVVCGRRRERFPEASVYNRLADTEWDTPVGRAKACGGDAMMRMDALETVGDYDPTLIAGEEPELCVRLRGQGWEVWRIDAEMVLHDAAMTRFSQFWKRMRRGGHAYAEGAAMHGTPPERHGMRGRNSALLWAVAIPALILLTVSIFGPWALLGVVVYPLQIARIARKGGGDRAAWERATFLLIGKFAEARGVVEYHLNALGGRRARLIEYK